MWHWAEPRAVEILVLIGFGAFRVQVGTVGFMVIIKGFRALALSGL